MSTLNLYDQDFYAWTQQQAKFLKEKAFDKLDISHLFEEVESMGKHEKRELSSRLTILLMHLLKWQFQPARQCKSWRLTIKEQRIEVEDILQENPSLKNLVDEYLSHSYKKAILKAAGETNLDEEIFPDKCEWTIEQVMDEEFFPN